MEVRHEKIVKELLYIGAGAAVTRQHLLDISLKT